MDGIFVAFEGVDGCGKSTQTELLREKLEKQGTAVFRTMEPTDGPIGLLLRKYLSRELKTDESAISALFAADRLDHLQNGDTGIVNMLKKGVSVLTDRFYLSSIAYQSVTLPMEWVIALNSHCMNICKPDLHIFLDVTPEIAFERIGNRKKNLDIYETLAFIKNVREMYFEAIEKLKGQENIAVIDSNAPPETVLERVYEVVSVALCQKRGYTNINA